MDTELKRTEKRHPIVCTNCGIQMVCMNKYIVPKDNSKVYVWYICPRRKKDGEKGCGHIAPMLVKKIAADKNAVPLLGYSIVGEVRSTENLTMIIEDNFETFQTWLHLHREKFKDKRVEVTVRTVDGK